MESIVALIVPFIAVSILSVLIDRLTLVLEAIMNRIPGLPDRLEWIFAYILVSFISFFICYMGDFDLFIYLDINFKYRTLGYLITSLCISGGSIYVRQQFDVMNGMPSMMSGVTSSFKSLFRK